MNEQEVLAQLRDIHVPIALGDAAPVEMAVWPFIGLAVVVAALLAIRFWRRNQWRQGARAEFSRIIEVEDRAAQWPLLIAFAASLPSRTQRPITLPSLVFRHPETISDTEHASFVDHLRAELGR